MMNTSLVSLFNSLVDYVKFDRKSETYVPVDRDAATHRLICTRWNNPPKPTANVKLYLRECRSHRPGFALSVCAMPISKLPRNRR